MNFLKIKIIFYFFILFFLSGVFLFRIAFADSLNSSNHTLNVSDSLFSSSSNNSSFFNEHAQGWHWYQNPDWIKPDDKTSKNYSTISPPQKYSQSLKNLSLNSKDPEAQMKLIQQELQKTLDQAILNPTEKNVSDYIRVQNLVNNQSSRFAQVWQAVLLKNPNLDYSIEHPTNQVGTQVYLGLEQKKEDQAIADLSKHYGFFFFFKSTCPYCHKFAPILQNFSNRYGISVVPVSLDGGGLPEFPHPQIDNGASNRFQVSVVPALFLVDPDTREVIPVAYGLTSETDIAKRLYEISKVLKEKRQKEEKSNSWGQETSNLEGYAS